MLESTDGKIWTTALYQPLSLTFFHSPLKLRSVFNDALEKYLAAHKEAAQKVPAFSVDEALQTAHKYLVNIGYEIPPNYHLTEINFNVDTMSMWSIEWRRYGGAFPYDNSDPRLANQIRIAFHETLGFSVFGFQDFLPEPKSLDVKVSRDDAIAKAGRAVLAVQSSPHYKAGRISGFVVRGLKEATLQVAAPNWLLDPKRAIRYFEKPPPEVRLCWVVWFTSADGDPEPSADWHLVPPKFVIYIDAATGEVVGAAFT